MDLRVFDNKVLWAIFGPRAQERIRCFVVCTLNQILAIRAINEGQEVGGIL
jgi:hypothetical protein